MASHDNQTPSDSSRASDLAAILGASGKGTSRRRKVLRWVLGCLVVLLLAGSGVWMFSGSKTQVTYRSQTIERGDLSVVVTATGSVQPTESVDVSSELSGTIRKVNIDYNSPVKKGEILAELDKNTLEANLQSAEAKLTAAEANVAKAQSTADSTNAIFKRKTELVGRNISSTQELDDARFNYLSAVAARKSAQAEVLVAQADLRQAQVNLSRADILSPIDGVVLTRSVDPGATVAASLSAPVLFTLAGDLKRMELQVDVDEADVGQVAVGQMASFTVDAYPGQTFPAVIQSIRFASETVLNVVTYKAVLSVDNDKGLLRPGMTATADITVQAIKDALLIPNAALRFTPPDTAQQSRSLLSLFRPPRMGPRNRPAKDKAAGAAIWLLRNGTPVQVTMQPGASDGQFTAVTSGDVKEGDDVITDATARAR
ncbi:efflux RND transporter periplasmic adaptor subunit [Rhizobium sp. CFBP 8762]|uniref:efflux RND transporter periplasmic adaptor subunit n=1 Tax=Rhizobium sp. CFBP 8762 TaxID=2775279 RepID=UPI00177FA588|nr:efflux RND transporter periplasmic adaptor subunit [Rhizobium sp. CFBP 8762]MBD8553612.1 efflux RND transporter periplasmic adaptor subunit [Rhizobium sp. CFBP 8762]